MVKSGNDVEEAYQKYCRNKRLLKRHKDTAFASIWRSAKLTVEGLESVYPDFKQRYANEHLDD